MLDGSSAGTECLPSFVIWRSGLIDSCFAKLTLFAESKEGVLWKTSNQEMM